jgi:hypothetical protein
LTFQKKVREHDGNGLPQDEFQQPHPIRFCARSRRKRLLTVTICF